MRILKGSERKEVFEMKLPRLSCPNQEKKTNRNINHPCKNCKWFNQAAFREYGSNRFACDHPDGHFLRYENGEYVYR